MPDEARFEDVVEHFEVLREAPIQQYGAPASEFDEGFITGMRKRSAVSFHKYGYVAQAKGHVNFIESAQQRIARYLETGNTEWLMDATNYIMFESMHPSHPSAHYRPTDSDESPGRIVQSRGVVPGTRHSKKPNVDL